MPKINQYQTMEKPVIIVKESWFVVIVITILIDILIVLFSFNGKVPTLSYGIIVFAAVSIVSVFLWKTSKFRVEFYKDYLYYQNWKKEDEVIKYDAIKRVKFETRTRIRTSTANYMNIEYEEKNQLRKKSIVLDNVIGEKEGGSWDYAIRRLLEEKGIKYEDDLDWQ